MRTQHLWTGALLLCAGALVACGGSGTTTQQPVLNIVVTPSTALVNDGSSLTLKLVAADKNNNAGAGTATVTAKAGSLGGGGKSQSLTLNNGIATTTFVCDVSSDSACDGQVSINATWDAAQTAALINVGSVIQLHDGGTDGGSTPPDGGSNPSDAGIVLGVPQTVTWVSTTCAGTNCSLMGVKNSGFNETAQVSFVVKDSSAGPLTGITVNFSLNNPPAGTLITATATSNAAGLVVATLSSGSAIGAVTVHASAVGGATPTADSPTIGIQGGKPANKGFRFYCDNVNLPAYISPTPPKVLSDQCHVALLDRFSNPVGTGTSVFFKTEAGTIPDSAASKAFDPQGNNAGEGIADVTFSTNGTFPPVNVSPLPAALGQPYPGPRAAEPSASGKNPRDSLVSVIAYVRGEEWYDDKNANGKWDPGEQFIDQGEPFVDSNDNGVYDVGESYIDQNHNNQWDGPNGVYDSDTTIWAETRVLYTGRASMMLPTGALNGPCPSGVPIGGTQSFPIGFYDDYFNIPEAGSQMSVAQSGTRGQVGLSLTSMQDGYGFGLQRSLVDPTDGSECLATTPICEWRALFTSWQQAPTSLKFDGVGAGDTNGCTPTTVGFTSTTEGIGTIFYRSGAVQ